jgi:aspartate carbamoyltransferase catalytic subunit
MQRLGGSVISCPDMKSSSTAKGESIADTARVVSSYADLLVVRHYWDGAVQAMAEYADVPVINAGDGSHEHPTQTLCDLYTLKNKYNGQLKGRTVVICGDLKHGRTIHSLIYALARFDVHLFTLPAKGMDLPQYVKDKIEREYHYSLTSVPASDLRAIVTKTDAIYLTPSKPHQPALFPEMTLNIQIRLEDLIPKFDAFYVTRRQNERITEKNTVADVDYPKIDSEFLKDRRFKDTVIMHPLPRVDELSHEVDKDSRAIYFKQAAYGVPVRMALLKFLFDAMRSGKSRTTQKEFLLYESPEPLGAQCPNSNCVTRTEAVTAHPKFEVLFTGPGGGLLLRCFYCDHQFKVQYMGHTSTRKYCLYDIALLETMRGWLEQKQLAVFDSIKQAEELGYKPYKRGPQRKIMDERKVQKAIEDMSEQILKAAEDPDRLLILGIRTKGLFLATRIAEQLEKQSSQKIEVGEIDIHNPGADIRRISPSAGEPFSPNVKDRPVILVDDVIHTGSTVKSALSIISKCGRPQSVRLAVLIERGHRVVPVKPDYVGKHIPSSEGQRVEVLLHEASQKKKDQVIIYSIIDSMESPEKGLTA